MEVMYEEYEIKETPKHNSGIQLNWVFGFLVILTIVYLFTVWATSQTDIAGPMFWAVLILVIIVLIYGAGMGSHRQGWKVFGFFGLVLYLLVGIPILLGVSLGPLPYPPIPPVNDAM